MSAFTTAKLSLQTPGVSDMKLRGSHKDPHELLGCYGNLTFIDTTITELGWCLTFVSNWRNSSLLPLPAILTLGHLLQELVADLIRDLPSMKGFQTENILAKESLCLGWSAQLRRKSSQAFFIRRFPWFSERDIQP